MSATLSKIVKRTAYTLLLPAVFLVFAIVLFPILANVWISFKEVGLKDIRIPEPRAKKIVKSNIVPKNYFTSFFLKNVFHKNQNLTFRKLKILAKKSNFAILKSEFDRCTNIISLLSRYDALAL